MHQLTLLLCLFSFAAAASTDCKDEFATCNDDCQIEFGGSIRVELKKRYEKCAKKCAKKENLCIERAVETKSNQLDEGSLDKSPGSKEVDENGIPNRAAESSSEKKTKVAPAIARDEEPESAPVKPKPELRNDEIPKSTRSEIKSESQPESVKKEEAAPVLRVEMKEKKAVDTDFRGDSASPTTKTSTPAKKVEEKPAEKPKDTTKKKQVPEEKKENFDDWKDL
jgi:hypothetical protein